tara:strand:+ start:364 stop:543 length:180 start_codon:yes stop_codon:yes gene_type:complete
MFYWYPLMIDWSNGFTHAETALLDDPLRDLTADTVQFKPDGAGQVTSGVDWSISAAIFH